MFAGKIFAALVVYSAACFTIGRLSLLGIIKSKTPVSPVIYLSTAFVLGQGILASAWLILSINGLFLNLIVVSAVIILAISALPILKQFYRPLTNQIHRYFNKFKREPWIWLIILGTILLFYISWGLSLGRSPFGDASAFYLAIAKLVAKTQRLIPIPGYEELMSIGFQAEMHFAALMLLGGAGSALLFDLPTFIAGSIFLSAIGKGAGLQPKGQILLLAMLVTSSVVVELIGIGKPDLFATTLGFAAYYWAVQLHRKYERYAFWLIGLFAGFAIMAKISYAVTLAPSLVTLIFLGYFKNANPKLWISWVRMMQDIMVTLIGGVLSLIPHILKNFALFGNPITPLGSNINSFSWMLQEWYGTSSINQILLTLPFALTFGNYWAQFGNLSFLVLAFLPLAISTYRPWKIGNNQNLIITISSLTGLAFWFIFRPSILAPRYFMSCLLLLIIPAAKAAGNVSGNGDSRRFIPRFIILLTAFSLISTFLKFQNEVFFPKMTYLYLSQQITECEKETRFCELLTTINNKAEIGTRLFTTDPVRYWLRTDLMQCLLTSSEKDAYMDLDSSDQRWSFIYGRGFNLIPVFHIRNYIENQVIEDLNTVPEWLTITKVEGKSGYLIKLDSLDPNHRPLVKCDNTFQSTPNLFVLSIQ